MMLRGNVLYILFAMFASNQSGGKWIEKVRFGHGVLPFQVCNL